MQALKACTSATGSLQASSHSCLGPAWSPVRRCARGLPGCRCSCCSAPAAAPLGLGCGAGSGPKPAGPPPSRMADAAAVARLADHRHHAACCVARTAKPGWSCRQMGAVTAAVGAAASSRGPAMGGAPDGTDRSSRPRDGSTLAPVGGDGLGRGSKPATAGGQPQEPLQEPEARATRCQRATPCAHRWPCRLGRDCAACISSTIRSILPCIDPARAPRISCPARRRRLRQRVWQPRHARPGRAGDGAPPLAPDGGWTGRR